MTFQEKIHSGKFLITSEIGPPKGADSALILEEAKILGASIDAINVTDLQSAVMRLSSLAGSIILKQNGFEPIFQVTCRDRNRLALQSDILAAAAFGIKNILILTGDSPDKGDHPQAKAVFDLNSIELLSVIKKLEEGFDMSGAPLEGRSPQFCAGAVVNPGAEPFEPEIMKMEKKIEHGAQFFQTQAIFDIEKFVVFLSKIKHLKTTILTGIIPLKSAQMARYMNKNISGIKVPDNLIKEMEKASDRRQMSMKIAVGLIKELKPMCAGVHIMPLGLSNLVPELIRRAELV
ncbi:MAG: methylenetetrahydrofolate reductase [Candidatus Omnitrophica bacterium]|nr:methylenetetrahydrofolate reductase [Candidatus Omnitrophota bacterium]